MSATPETASLFVQIASYRDPECHRTLTDLFEKAAHPERIRVGICWQYDSVQDADYLAVPYPRGDQVRIIHVPLEECQGAGYARNIAHRLYGGEDYTLQIHAHTRFAPGWDVELIRMLSRCDSHKPVITGWLPGYTPGRGKNLPPGYTTCARVGAVRPKDDPQIVHYVYRVVTEAEVGALPPQPFPSWIGNFLFARSALFDEVAFDPHIYFWGEEVDFSARAWTHGWDFFQFDRTLLYHYWDRNDAKDSDTYRPYENPRNVKTLKRLRHRLGLEQTDDAAALEDMEKYPLGDARALAEYWRYYGVDPVKGARSARARLGAWRKYAPIGEKPARPRIFVQIAAYRDPECQFTVKSLFDRAKHPEHISVGICWQVDRKADANCFGISYANHPRVREIVLDYRDSLGAGHARHLAGLLREDEEYSLLIDSHMRFVDGWDEILLDLIERAPSKKPLITSFSPIYYPPNRLSGPEEWRRRISVNYVGEPKDGQVVHLTGHVVDALDPRVELYRSPFCIFNFLFAPSSTFEELPFDPHLHFWGDEITYSARLWTHGYDIFQTDRHVAFHAWYRDTPGGDEAAQYRKPDTPQNKASAARVRHILQLEESKNAQTSKEMGLYGIGTVRSMQSFWEYTGIDIKQRTASTKAKRGFWDKPVDTQTGQGKIFVQIAAYRDPECQHTVADLFAKAKHPERIFVGICWQIDAQEDAHLFIVPYPRPAQVREVRIDWRKALGVCWARWVTQSLWEGEEYTLQIDSHMRFEQNWDAHLLAEYARCPSDKPILSGNIAKYTLPNELEENPKSSVLRTGAFNAEGNIRNRGAKLARHPDAPLNAAFIAAGFLFARAGIIREVPYDPYMYFDQEEISLAMRFYTHGWDIYTPTRPYVYHHYVKTTDTARPFYWKDARQEEEAKKRYMALRARATARFNHLSGFAPSEDAQAVQDLEFYGLGNARSLAQYQAYCGIDFSTKRVSEYALRGRFIEGLEHYLAKEKLYVPELDDKDAAPVALMSEQERLKQEQTLRPARAADAKMPRIFVQIAAYRDPECQHTVADLFAKAKHPERIFVGICWQFDAQEDRDCFTVPYTYPDQVRVKHFHVAQSQGMNWARATAQSLWQGEEFVLQLDSHMRFEPGWDETLMDMWRRTNDKQAVISAFLPGYTAPDTLKRAPGKLSRMRVDRMADPKHPSLIHFGGYLVPQHDAERKGLYRSPFIIGNFIFAPSRAFSDVPLDPHLYFHGYEITWSARLWTHGYNVYQPDTPVAYHQWVTPETFKKQGYKRPDAEGAQRTLIRVCHLLKLQECTEPDILLELDRYGLGINRTLASFWRFMGVDMEAREATENAMRGIWNMAAEEGAVETTEITQTDKHTNGRIFVQIAAYRDPECQHTIRELFEKAARPQRIIVGLCLQIDRTQDQHCLEVPYAYPDQVRVKEFRPEQAEGANWARAQAFSLWRGEPYVLQIDSHMRFEQGWDDTLIDMLKRAEDPRAVLTQFCPGYVPPRDIQCKPAQVSRIRVRDFSSAMHPAFLHLAGDLISTSDKERGGLYPSPFICAHFVFAAASMFRRVPTDPHIFFNGDEITLSARLWTHGYNVYQVDTPIAYTLIQDGEAPYKQAHNAQAQDTLRRVRHLLALDIEEDPRVLAGLERYGHGIERDLESFWQFAGVHPEKRQISDSAKSGKWNLDVWEKYKKSAAADELIFVQIAAYRDPECQHTVKDLFERATFKDRIKVGICWQFDHAQDAHCFTVPYPRPTQVKVMEVKADDSKGACWARSKTQSMYNGEEYTLQIDSHMRFETGWDELLIDMLHAAEAESETGKAVLTTYPSGYTPPRQIPHRITHKLTAKQFDKDGIFTMNSAPIAVDPPPAKPVPGAFMGACMFFGRGSIVRDVPYDPHLYFFGEEITLSVRFWTHGYDIFHPNLTAMYHFWERKGRRTHFEDHHEWGALNRLSFARVKHMLGTEPSSDADVLRELNRYGLGFERSLSAYQQFAGVDFARRIIQPSAYKGVFPASAYQPEEDSMAPPKHDQGVSPVPVNTSQSARRPTLPAHQVMLTALPNAPMDTPSASYSGPRKTLETPQVIVYDDFLPEELYARMFEHASQIEYQYINTHGKVQKVWDIGNGFPLRSMKSTFYYPNLNDAPKHENQKMDWVYPSRTAFDLFIEQVNTVAPQAAHMVGQPERDWEHYSVTSWLYPPGTGLSMHDDGSGVYSGAYVYFMNPVWRPHWGGLLVVMEEEANESIQRFKQETDAYAMHKKKWLHVSQHNEMMMEHGFARCIFPKRNRLVFIANDAFHMVTQVLPQAGDNVRMSLAGFFHRPKERKEGEGAY